LPAHLTSIKVNWHRNKNGGWKPPRQPQGRSALRFSQT
jgi:hypothetical protein